MTDVRGFVRRRWRIMILPLFLITSLCIVGAYTLPRKYEAATTILVQREDAGNPLLQFKNPVTMYNPNEDKFKTYNEIIYSRRTLEALMDSIGVAKSIRSETQKQKLLKELKSNITTEKRGSDSFRITYVDSNPLSTYIGTSALASIFIQTTLNMQNKENDLAVQFFEKQLNELHSKFEVSQKERQRELNKRINEVPTEERLLYSNMDDVERTINEIDTKVKLYRQALATLRTYPGAFQTENGKQALFNLQYVELPFMSELHALLGKYEDYSRKYTAKYPDLEMVKRQIVDLVARMRSAVEVEITKQLGQRADLERKRGQLVSDIRRSSVVQKTDQEKESNYEIYRQLYDETKVKFEQAQAIRDLGMKGKNQFVILDPPQMPSEPSKPSRAMLIGGGFGVGMLLGVILGFVAEMLDPRIRSLRDIEVYEKPIIAFIPEGRHELPY